ncbi:MAG: hypothetical protein HYX32_02870 [Actinobacteria bacterium]|nr:hypothetical protein [Actinomycetota bacterium]
MAELLRLFELADEFGITTGQAMDLCDEAGVSAESGSTLLTATDAAALRAAAHQLGLGDRAVGRAAGRPPGGDDPAIAPPPGWVRMADAGPTEEPAPAPPLVPEAPRKRRGRKRSGRPDPPS